VSVIIDHQPINQPSGSREYIIGAVPSNVTSCTVRLARCTSATPTFWPNANTQANADIWLSYDGGTTYPIILIGFGASGGIGLINGVEVAESAASGSDPAGAIAGRRLKAVITIQNGPLVSQLTVETN
jgi:hypothetical protein